MYQLQYYSHCDYKFWQYNAKYAYHADKLSCSHSCWLETFGISFNVNSRRVEGGGGGGVGMPPSFFPTTTAAMFLNPKLVKWKC